MDACFITEMNLVGFGLQSVEIDYILVYINDALVFHMPSFLGSMTHRCSYSTAYSGHIYIYRFVATQ